MNLPCILLLVHKSLMLFLKDEMITVELNSE